MFIFKFIPLIIKFLNSIFCILYRSMSTDQHAAYWPEQNVNTMTHLSTWINSQTFEKYVWLKRTLLFRHLILLKSFVRLLYQRANLNSLVLMYVWLMSIRYDKKDMSKTTPIPKCSSSSELWHSKISTVVFSYKCLSVWETLTNAGTTVMSNVKR